MSGPKYSDYVLERQRLLIIKAQLEADWNAVNASRLFGEYQ